MGKSTLRRGKVGIEVGKGRFTEEEDGDRGGGKAVYGGARRGFWAQGAPDGDGSYQSWPGIGDFRRGKVGMTLGNWSLRSGKVRILGFRAKSTDNFGCSAGHEAFSAQLLVLAFVP